MPDSGGEGQESRSDACFDALKGACAVLFEGELAFESVEDGFYPLPDPAEVAEAWLLILPVGSDEVAARNAARTCWASGSVKYAEKDLFFLSTLI